MHEMSAADPVRERLRELLHEKKLSHQRLCNRLTEMTGEPWLVQRFGKLLNGSIMLRVEDLVLIARAAEISLVEIVRERGRELAADLTPTELQLVQGVRDNPALLAPFLALIPKTPKPKPTRRMIRDRMRADR